MTAWPIALGLGHGNSLFVPRNHYPQKARFLWGFSVSDIPLYNALFFESPAKQAARGQRDARSLRQDDQRECQSLQRLHLHSRRQWHRPRFQPPPLCVRYIRVIPVVFTDVQGQDPSPEEIPRRGSCNTPPANVQPKGCQGGRSGDLADTYLVSVNSWAFLVTFRFPSYGQAVVTGAVLYPSR